MSTILTESEVQAKEDTLCYHCGQPCENKLLQKEDHSFCCYGCKTVYEILSENDLCEYYNLQKNPGLQRKAPSEETYAFLNEPDIRKKVLEFDSDAFARVRFFIPNIHCVSCIWLLENLQKLSSGILHAEVNFARKTVVIDFNPQKTSLAEVAELIDSIGYAPKINLESDAKKEGNETNTNLVIKLAIAGFCFGNVMLLSFPEYLGLDKADETLMRVFSWLNVALSVPVLLYSGADYLRAAWRSIEQRQINIDVPIAVGLVALFFRSLWDITTYTGPGYLDSFTGLVFFLLIGRWFQSKTYESLAFDRDFKSYFPLAVNRLVGDEWKPVVIYELDPGDQIRVRNMEIVPADSVLLSQEAFIDYSFVTGESRPVHVNLGNKVYAGGRLIGQPVVLVVQKKTSQSHLTSLWNNDAFRKAKESQYKKLSDRVARVFTWAVLALAIATALFWYIHDASQMWLVVTAVLMVACPCALALAAPFTYGNMVRIFGHQGLYLKNADIIEQMASIDSVVFDKTGTITHGTLSDVHFTGTLTSQEIGWVNALTRSSTHPLSMLIARNTSPVSSATMEDFRELPGKGLEATFDGHVLKVGSAPFTGFHEKMVDSNAKVFVAIDGEVRGYYSVGTSVREQIHGLVSRLNSKVAGLLSGDQDNDRGRMEKLFSNEIPLHFNQSPHDKLHFVRSLQERGNQVMMLGDGLNDSGALKQSDVGIAVTDDTGVFTPACDGILHGERIGQLDVFLSLSKSAIRIVRAGFAISFFYNVIALSFATTGHLTPLVAAILMPISSISVVVFTTLAVNFVASRKKW